MSQNNDFINDIQKSLNNLSKYRLELGVFTGRTKRKVQVGMTNAELMFVHENGSPLRSIPARPVLQMTIDYANQSLISKTVDKCIALILDGKENEIENELKRLAIKIENYARNLIYRHPDAFVPNSIGVQKTKGKKVDPSGKTLINHPLFDTGQLARSITCRVVHV